MSFLRVFARIVVEVWRRLADRIATPHLFLAAFDIIAERAIERLTMHGVVDAMIERGALRGGRAV